MVEDQGSYGEISNLNPNFFFLKFCAPAMEKPALKVGTCFLVCQTRYAYSMYQDTAVCEIWH